jgi:hypothetical protein
MPVDSDTNLSLSDIEALLPAYYQAAFERIISLDSVLLNEGILFQAAFSALAKMEKAYPLAKQNIQRLRDDKQGLLNCLTAFIQSTYPHLIMDDIQPDFDNEQLKKTIGKFAINPTDNAQDGLFNFLASMVTMYRTSLNKTPLLTFLRRLDEDKELLKKLKKRLRDSPKKEGNELWGSGNHEWLPCQLIKSLLERSAGMHSNVESFIVKEENDIVLVIDWLSLHKQFRSEVKSLYFLNDERQILSGHVPAVRDRLEGSTLMGTKTAGTRKYHDALVRAFRDSKNMREYVRRCRHIEKAYLFRGKKVVEPSDERYFTVTGRRTDKKDSMSKLRHQRIKPAHHIRKQLMQFLENQTAVNGREVIVPSPTSTLSEKTRWSRESNRVPVSDSQHDTFSKSASSTLIYSLIADNVDDNQDNKLAIAIDNSVKNTDYLLLLNVLHYSSIDPYLLCKIKEKLLTLERLEETDKQLEPLYHDTFKALDACLSPKIKRKFIIQLYECYGNQPLSLPKEEALLRILMQVELSNLIWFFKQINLQSYQPALLQLINIALLSTPISMVNEKIIQRARLYERVLRPFFLKHRKTGDGCFGNLRHKRKDKLKNEADIQTIMEEAKRHCSFGPKIETQTTFMDYYMLTARYQALFTIVAQASNQYTRKRGFAFCGCFFPEDESLSHLSDIQLHQMKLIKRVYVKEIKNLLLESPKKEREALKLSIEADLIDAHHFMNTIPSRGVPRCFGHEKNMALGTLNHELKTAVL